MTNLTRILMREALQDLVDPKYVVTVKFMKGLGKKSFERRAWRQTTLSEYMELEVGEPYDLPGGTISYTVNIFHITPEKIGSIYQELSADLQDYMMVQG